MKKARWNSPVMAIERFVPQEYVAVCTNDNGEIIYDGFHCVSSEVPPEGWLLIADRNNNGILECQSEGDQCVRFHGIDCGEDSDWHLHKITAPHFRKGWIVKSANWIDYPSDLTDEIRASAKEVWVWDGQTTGTFYSASNAFCHVSYAAPTPSNHS